MDTELEFGEHRRRDVDGLVAGQRRDVGRRQPAKVLTGNTRDFEGIPGLTVLSLPERASR
jgi:hypothetical protein